MTLAQVVVSTTTFSHGLPFLACCAQVSVDEDISGFFLLIANVTLDGPPGLATATWRRSTRPSAVAHLTTGWVRANANKPAFASSPTTAKP